MNMDRVTRRTGRECISVLAEGGRSAACARDNGRAVQFDQAGLNPGSGWRVGTTDREVLRRIGLEIQRVEAVATVRVTEGFPLRSEAQRVARNGAGPVVFSGGSSAPGGFAAGPATQPELPIP